MTSTNHETKRSFNAALAVGEKIRKGVMEDEDNRIAREALTSDLLEEALKSAWKFQFEDDRAGFRRELKSLVEDSVESQVLEETK